ncbi:MAG: type II secretion system protein GspL [Cypionkella sp.]
MTDHKSVSTALRPAFRFLVPSRLRRSDRSAAKANLPATDISFVASEDVLLLAVPFPKMPPAQRRSVAGFAVEDLIAQPLDQCHVVLGPQVKTDEAGGVWLVAVVSLAVMDDIVRAHAGSQAVLLPDVLALQVPSDGAWSVLAQGARALVRLPDATGFAADHTMLATLWAAAGQPNIVLLGGVLPEDLPVAEQSSLTLLPDPALRALDLRRGRFARRGSGLPLGLRSLGLISAVALLGHLGLLLLDVLGLGRIAATQEATLRAAFEAQGVTVQDDLATTLTSVLAAQQPAKTGEFLTSLSDTFTALKPQVDTVQIKDLRYTRAQNTLSVTMEAPDLASLQTAETALTSAGLGVTAGAATSANGAAEVEMTLRGAAP